MDEEETNNEGRHEFSMEEEDASHEELDVDRLHLPDQITHIATVVYPM
jgi:hypothetical protein